MLPPFTGTGGSAGSEDPEPSGVEKGRSQAPGNDGETLEEAMDRYGLPAAPATAPDNTGDDAH